MKHHRVLVFIAALTAVTLIAPQPAPADLGLDVSPAKLELSMAPGTTYNVPITIRNGAENATHVQASLVDFGVAENGDYQIKHVGTLRDSLMRWASINPREFDLAPGNTQQVRLSLALPNSNLSGEYAGIAFFQTRPTRRAGAVALSVRVASKFYLTIPNTVKIDGAITKMTASSGAAGETYRVLFKNLGNAHVYLRGEVLVKKGDQTVAQLPMQDEMLVERGGERLIEVSGQALAPGKYMVIAMIDYGGKTQTGGEILYNKK
jgi:P pilus assembly chaperone PapD